MTPNFETTVEGSNLSLSEASKLINKPENTIREWVKSRKIEGKRDHRGRWLICRDELLAYAFEKASTEGRAGASSKANQKAKTPFEGSIEASVEPSKDRYIRTLESSLEREQRINDELRARIRELEQERTQHLAEMRALLNKDVKAGDGIISRWLRK